MHDRQRGQWRGGAAFAVVVALSALVASPGGAVPERPSAAARVVEPLPGLSDGPLISGAGEDPVLDGVQVVTDAAVRRADDRMVDAKLAAQFAGDRLASAQEERDDVVAKAASAGSALVDARSALTAAEAELARQERELAARQAVTDRRLGVLRRERQLLRKLAAAMFTSKPVDEMTGLSDFETMSEGVRRDAVRDSVAGDQSAVVDGAQRSWRTARGASRAQGRRTDRADSTRKARSADVAEATEIRDHLEAFQRSATSRVDARQADVDAAAKKVEAARIDRRVARLTAQVQGSDLTLVDLHAYWRAAAVAPCAIPWWVLAGVGRVESHHGTAQGSTVGADGTTSVRILGIPLDGRPGVAAIGDTDGGVLDGSASVDRAVGPMQFIPSTWFRWAADANGDGKQDPHNLYDAAGAAANYLCFGRGPLVTDAAIRGALLSYNQSVPYGTAVLGYAHGYQQALDLPDLPPDDAGLPVAGAGAPG